MGLELKRKAQLGVTDVNPLHCDWLDGREKPNLLTCVSPASSTNSA